MKKLESEEELLGLLIRFFKEEEKAIANGRKSSYVTDDYENGVRSFAAVLVKELMNYHAILDGLTSYGKLLEQKHMAYAFYHLLNMDHIDPHNLLKDIRYRKNLYQGLMEFYSTFYGSFADNEEAICLLCKYYPKEDDLWLEHDKVVRALFDHIKNAGTSRDFGYAYHGIEQIQKYIDGLPHTLILELLKQYRLHDVLIQKVYRHQIFAIIHCSELKKADKYAWKFFYLDSLLLANSFNRIWVEKEKERDGNIAVYYNDYDENLAQGQIQVLKNPNAYWDNEDTKMRQLLVDKQVKARIYVEKGEIIFYFLQKREVFKFKYDDWELEYFQTEETREKLRSLISGTGKGKPEEKQMVFSMLYLDNYRGIKKQILDFDHRFMFYPDSREIKLQETERKPGLHFYGKAVYSLSCIVGKNGTGKTSIVDFLRDTFYKILKMLEEFDIPCEKGCISIERFQEQKILDVETKFLVVFRIGEENYYLTNIPGIRSTGVLPYQKGICQDIDFCKVVFFSQQLRTDQMIYLENRERTDRREVLGISRTLDGIGQCDYSEMKSFLRRKIELAVLHDQKENEKTASEVVINKELYYQLSFLKNVSTQKICSYLDISPERRFTIYSIKSGETLKEFLLKECKDNLKMKELEKEYARMPDAEIGFVSSGQYAKFVFLAKLYWFLEGYHKDSEYYKKLFKSPDFSREDALHKEESALIFIDEGELYYHPEWQRRYLSTLLDMLCLCRQESKLQIVFTTNSPFLISDVLKEDVQYLSDKEYEFGDTLGQNIHKLLKNNFFMDYTIGEYSRKLIETLIWRLGDENEKNVEVKKDLYGYFDNKQDEYEMIGFLIQQIGEPIYRDKLGKMLEDQMRRENNLRESRIRELERQKADLEREIVRLKEEENGENGTL